MGRQRQTYGTKMCVKQANVQTDDFVDRQMCSQITVQSSRRKDEEKYRKMGVQIDERIDIRTCRQMYRP